MSQNLSTAVMQRRFEPHDSLDFFPTPPWATRALMEHVIGNDWRRYRAWEPACGEGHMARPLAEYFETVDASDVQPYGFGRINDFLMPACEKEDTDWIITNPPFRLAPQFIERGRAIYRSGMAMLVRIAFLEGVARHRDLFTVFPPNVIAQFVERVPMVKGRLSQEATTATAYCWLVWWGRDRAKDTLFRWIPPCRKQLERDSDYAEPE